MKKIWNIGLISSLCALCMQPVFAAKNDWLVRALAIDIVPDTSSSALKLDASNEWTPEIDVSYFVTDHFAVEVMGDIPQKTTITSNGAKVGTVKLLPPTVLLQYHFLPEEIIHPYLGAGINYTRFYDIHLGNGTLTVDKNSWGGALQGGLNIDIAKNWFFNLDVKKVWISTDVKVVSTGAKAASFDINPWIFGIGIGFKF